MDTKLKSTKYAPVTKGIITVLLIISVFFTTLFGFKVFSVVFDYGDIFFENTEQDFTKTRKFNDMMSRYLVNLELYTRYKDVPDDKMNETVKKDFSSELAYELQNVIERYSQNIQELNDSYPFEELDNMVVDHVYTEYYMYNDKNVMILDAENRKAILDEKLLTQLYNDHDGKKYIEDQVSGIQDAVKEIESISSVKHYIVRNSDGQVTTNIPQEKHSSYAAYFDSFSWHLSYTQNDGLQLSERINGTNRSFTRAYIQYDDYMSQRIDTESVYSNSSFNTLSAFGTTGYQVFIAYDEAASAKDVFISSSLAYSSDIKAVKPLFAACTVFLIFGLILFVMLVVLSGRTYKDSPVKLAFIDRLYNDLHLIASGTLAAVLGSLMFESLNVYDHMLFDDYSYSMLSLMSMPYLIALLTCAMVLVLLEYVLSAARHIKNKTLFKHSLLYKVLYFIKRCIKKIVHTFRVTGIDRQLHKTVRLSFFLFLAAEGILGFFTVIFASNGDSFSAFFFSLIMIILFIICIILCWKYITSIEKIMFAAEKAKNGDYSVNLNISDMPKHLKKFAYNVMQMQSGIVASVNEAVKNEKMKTELITNVSHDLKTPLTSIVNYVDLLKGCDIQDETAKTYIGVLAEKADRLKHLIEDLVEASKVSSGNVDIHPQNINLNEFALQVMGENRDKFDEIQLDMHVCCNEEQPTFVFADSQKTWRIIENLFSNVGKYAMPGTRVYIDVETDAARRFGIFTVKNISKTPLNIPAETLLQRFVRADQSRTTQGSGLGLSVAENLCKLQNGEFHIAIDGDLFKATVRLPLAQDYTAVQ